MLKVPVIVCGPLADIEGKTAQLTAHSHLCEDLCVHQLKRSFKKNLNTLYQPTLKNDTSSPLFHGILFHF